MAADPFRHLIPGETEVAAAGLNAALDAGKAFRAGVLGRPLKDRAADKSALTVLVQNMTGAALDVRSVLRVSDSPVDPVTVPEAFRSQPVFEGSEPDADDNCVVVLDEALPAGEIGRAVIAGVTACEVDVGATSDGYAKPIAGDSAKLESSSTPTGIRLLVAGGTGVRNCVVLLGGGAGGESGGGGVIVRADATGADSITCYIQRSTGATLEDDPDLDPITVRRFVSPVRNNFEEDGYYLAVEVGELWYAETGFRREAKGKLDGTLTFGGSATMSVWEWSGSAEADTTEDITVFDWCLASGQTIASGRKVIANQMKTATGWRWYVLSAECP